MSGSAEEDRAHMQAALGLARRGLGTTWPNPPVGCVIVRDGRVAGRGRTAAGGRPHAETQALAMAGEAARGATAYVTLEPCSHHGRTPPCADAIVAAGIARVVVATRDPDPRVRGSGIARLQAAGIAVTEAVLAAEAEEVAAGFLSVQASGRPLVTLKLATTLDGRIATHSGESKWITGEPARRMAHALRGRHDAVLVGVGTVLTDDPDLRCRIDGFRPVPAVRVVADSRLRMRLVSRLVATAREAPVWVLAREDAAAERRTALAQAGVEVIGVAAASVGIEPEAGLRALAARGITTVLVEGGAQIAASLLRAGLVDRLAWFHAPAVMGADGWPAAQAFGVEALAQMPRFVPLRTARIGEDNLTELQRSV